MGFNSIRLLGIQQLHFENGQPSLLVYNVKGKGKTTSFIGNEEKFLNAYAEILDISEEVGLKVMILLPKLSENETDENQRVNFITKILKKYSERKIIFAYDFFNEPLYFDNDFPDPKTWRTTSTQTYLETYPPYYSRKNEFKELYSEPLIGQNKEVAETDVVNFFDNEVLAGKQDLERFLEQLEAELAKGEKITLVISGFASPKYLRDYNLNLSKRRINTLRKQLQAYEDGLFAQYLNNGSLNIEGQAYGSDSAPQTVSDSQEDIRNSVFSPAASRERRIEIVDIIRN